MSEPPTVAVPDQLLVSPEEAARLDRDAASWPEVVLTPAELSALELRLALEPGSTSGYVVRSPASDGSIAPGGRVALREAEGVLLAVLEVATVVGDGSTVSGRLLGVRFPAHPDAAGLRRTPAELRREIERRKWRSVHGVVTDRPLFTADLLRIRDRLTGGDSLGSAADGVVVGLLAGGVAATDPEHHTRLAALRAGLATLPRDRVLLTVLPLPLAAGPDERRRVAAGWGLPDADVEPAPGSPSDATVLAALERPGSDAGTDVRLVPAEVLAALRRTHRPRVEQGFTVFFTGLSGSGKSTVAGLLAVRLLELTSRSVLLLDGDRVRRHLTAGLGFSQADRDTNVRRIGWVAAQVSAAGGIAVCAPIAPYDGTRRQVRAMVEGSSPSAGFVLVHIATPLEECERRDRKGLYAKARAGQLPGFTGISDPYEVPQDAEVVADTTGREPADVVDEILRYLVGAGYLGQPAPTEAITS